MATREAAFQSAQQRANQTGFAYAIYQSRNGQWLWGPYNYNERIYKTVIPVLPNP